MNKLEMQTMESRRLLRMTHTERANHERIKREILGARGLTAFDALWAAAAADRFVGRFKLPKLGGPTVAVGLPANLPDAQLLVSNWDEYARGDIVRRRVIGDEAFAVLTQLGQIAPVKRPRDGTVRDYVVAEGNILTCREGGGGYYPGETLPDYVTDGQIYSHIMGGRIELAE